MRFVLSRNGIPGAYDATIDALPGSTLPDELRACGYDVWEIGERRAHSGRHQAAMERADGSLWPVTESPTMPVMTLSLSITRVSFESDAIPSASHDQERVQ